MLRICKEVMRVIPYIFISFFHLKWLYINISCFKYCAYIKVFENSTSIAWKGLNNVGRIPESGTAESILAWISLILWYTNIRTSNFFFKKIGARMVNNPIEMNVGHKNGNWRNYILLGFFLVNRSNFTCNTWWILACPWPFVWTTKATYTWIHDSM